MVVAKLIEIGSKMMKLLSECDIRMGDYKYLDMYADYREMRSKGEKMTYIVEVLSEKYGISVASVYRLISKFGKPINT